MQKPQRNAPLGTMLLLTLLSATLLPLHTISQASYPDPANWHIEHMPISEQMGSNSIYSIAEDPEGYLWFTSNNGIARFDGYYFKNYTCIPDDSTTLNHNRASFAYLDHNGTLWIGTRVGINRYMRSKDSFKRYDPSRSPLNRVPEGEVNWITEDKDSNLWVVTQHGGLYRYDPKEDLFTRLLYQPEDPENLSDDHLRTILCDREGWIWIGTGEPFTFAFKGNGLVRFNPKTGKAKRYLHDPGDLYSLTDNRVSALLQDSQGNIWAGSCNSGLHLYDPVHDRFIRMVENDRPHPKYYARQAGVGPWASCAHVRILKEDQWGGFWVGNFNGGIYRFDPSGAPPVLFEYKPEGRNSLANNMVWNFFEDSQGRFWLGNMDGGLMKIEPWQKKFQSYFINQNVTAVFESPDEPRVVWIALWEEGLCRWDRNTGEKRYFKKSEQAPEGPASNIIFKILQDRKKNLWFATDNGLSRYDRLAKRFSHYPAGIGKKGEEKSINIYEIYEDRKGMLWLGTFADGLFQFDPVTGRSTHFPLPLRDGAEKDTYNQTIHAVHEDERGILWLGTWLEGLLRLDPKTGHCERFLDNVGIQIIKAYEPDYLWLGTEDHGLIHLSTRSGDIRTFSAPEHLPGNKVFSLLKDQQEYLWMSTNKGIARLNVASGEFDRFGTPDGVPANGAKDVSCAWKGEDGTFYFGTERGLATVQPLQLMKNTTAPVVHITDVRLFNKSFRKGKIDSFTAHLAELPSEMKLRHHQNELTFEYVGLHYTNPELNQYRHRLLPYDKQWIEAGNKRSARYTNLSPGSYRFEVIASNSDGIWANQPASIKVVILPPWWKTWWAYLMYALLVFSLLFGIYRFKKRRWALQASLQMEKEESRRLRELDEFKSRFYSNITHEFRTPLTVILGLADEVEKNPNKKLKERIGLLKKNGRHLLHLVNQVLDLARLNNRALQLHPIQDDVISFLQVLTDSFHSYAMSKKIGLQFFSETDQILMDFDPNRLQHIVSNLLSNAFKFTPAYGKVLVFAKHICEKDKEQLEIRVKDTGQGMEQAELAKIFDRFYQIDNSWSRRGEGTGVGLALVKELTQLMDGKVWAESEPGKGSTFFVRLPVERQAPPANTMIEVQSAMPVSPAEKITALQPSQTRENVDQPQVLVIEDNADVIYYLRECLSADWQVLTARNGNEGVRIATEQVPDVIISDVMMPGMDGLEVCKKIKSDERTSHIPILLLTARASQQDKLAGLDSGADAYLVKPFDREELLVRLRNFRTMQEKLQAFLSSESANDTPPTPEQQFLKKVNQAIENSLDNTDFNTHHLTRSVGMSRVQLHRKLKALTGMPTSLYIRTYRLKRAKYFLETTDLTVSEIAWKTGFNNLSWFAQAFREAFGHSPSETRK